MPQWLGAGGWGRPCGWQPCWLCTNGDVVLPIAQPWIQLQRRQPPPAPPSCLAPACQPCTLPISQPEPPCLAPAPAAAAVPHAPVASASDKGVGNNQDFAGIALQRLPGGGGGVEHLGGHHAPAGARRHRRVKPVPDLRRGWVGGKQAARQSGVQGGWRCGGRLQGGGASRQAAASCELGARRGVAAPRPAPAASRLPRQRLPAPQAGWHRWYEASVPALGNQTP